MTRLDIFLDGRSYTVACEPGQEGRLRRLTAYVNERLQAVRAEQAGGSEIQVLALVSLMLADRIFDLTEEVATLNAGVPESELAAGLEVLAARLEELAGRVERS